MEEKQPLLILMPRAVLPPIFSFVRSATAEIPSAGAFTPSQKLNVCFGVCLFAD
jgi:hypothetical protein